MLKPQDVMILLKVVTYEGKPFVMKDLAASLQLSPGEITFGLERCKNSGLIDAKRNIGPTPSRTLLRSYFVERFDESSLNGMWCATA